MAICLNPHCCTVCCKGCTVGPRRVTLKRYREVAREDYADPSDDAITVDDRAKVSRGEGGAFVQAWVWVADNDCGAADGEG